MAGNAVKNATEHLVRAAKQAIDADDERTLVINQRMVSGIAQVGYFLINDANFFKLRGGGGDSSCVPFFWRRYKKKSESG